MRVHERQQRWHGLAGIREKAEAVVEHEQWTAGRAPRAYLFRPRLGR
ncbi:MAG: hypothetical protein WD794_00265 [Mycobacteriales bacterium]